MMRALDAMVVFYEHADEILSACREALRTPGLRVVAAVGSTGNWLGADAATIDTVALVKCVGGWACYFEPRRNMRWVDVSRQIHQWYAGERPDGPRERESKLVPES
jgi:hypothetical protein